jgi:hypothetical protein
MTFFLLLAALAMAGAGVWMSRRWRILGQAMIALGGLALIGVIVLQFRQNVLPSRHTASRRNQMAASYGLANCLLEDAGSQGGKVVLLFPQRSDMDDDTEGIYADGFIPPLRHGRVKLDLKAVRLEGASRDLSAFKQALAQTPEAMAVVSYAGVPEGFETLYPAGQPESPSFYVLDSEGTTRWLGALKEGRIRAVVVPRPGVDARGGEEIAGRPETVFEKFYLLATQANADEVAAGLKTESTTRR